MLGLSTQKHFPDLPKSLCREIGKCFNSEQGSVFIYLLYLDENNEVFPRPEKRLEAFPHFPDFGCMGYRETLA